MNKTYSRFFKWPGRQMTTFAALALGTTTAMAGVSKMLEPPGDHVSAEELAKQVYFANHFYAFKNFSIDRKRDTMTVLVTRASDGDLSYTGVERHLNNSYEGDAVKARDLAIFHSGKYRGMGMLVTDYSDDDKSQNYMVWLPQLRKVRRFAEPKHEESWGGSVFTFGDVTLRKPEHETHEIIGKKRFRTCLGVIEELEGRTMRHVDKLPKRACRHVGKEVYGLKSTTKFEDWWYDYRVSFVDTHSFADYRTAYYKDGKLIKVIDRDWGLVSEKTSGDQRSLFWKYWYGVELDTGRESWAVIPQAVVDFNTDKKDKFWTESTLRRLKR
jgi:hypothetical protein